MNEESKKNSVVGGALKTLAVGSSVVGAGYGAHKVLSSKTAQKYASENVNKASDIINGYNNEVVPFVKDLNNERILNKANKITDDIFGKKSTHGVNGAMTFVGKESSSKIKLGTSSKLSGKAFKAGGSAKKALSSLRKVADITKKL